MKKLMFIIFVFISVAVYSQIKFPYDSIKNEIYYTGIKEVSATKAELYSRAKTWIATNMKSYKATVDLDDQNSGKIIAKIINKKILNNDGWWESEEFTITIDCKDNKFRYMINNIKFQLFFIVGRKETLSVSTMVDRMNLYHNGPGTEAGIESVRLNNMFIDISESIVKALCTKDEF